MTWASGYSIAKGRGARGQKEFELVGDQHLQRRFQHLMEIGTKKQKIKRALNRAAKPMRMAARSYAKHYQSETVEARTGPDGYVRPHLWKSIQVFGSKKYRGVLWLGARKNRRYRAYHASILEKGAHGRRTRKGADRGGYAGKRYMLRAYNATKGMVLRNMGHELDKIIKEETRL